MKLRPGMAPMLLVIGLALAGLLAVAGVAHSAFSTDQAVTPVKVRVSMTDYKFALSTKSVPRGKPVVFTITNRGRSPHDFDFTTLNKGTPVIQPGKRTTLRVTFRKKGRFRYICTVPRHVQFGMAGYFVVK
jgi:uncharacterized cupredoxin-like copper-binding protein